MIYAIDKKNNKIKADKKKEGYCPMCDEKLIPKCGLINIWHWSHKNNTDCDTWYNGETEWHINWKLLVNQKYCEVSIKKDNKIHRADILHPNWVIELQNSSISSYEIIQRELFYNNMIWIINGKEFKKNFNLTYDRQHKNYSFKWLWARKTFKTFNKKIFIDFGDILFRIKHLSNNCKWGYGEFIEFDNFLRLYLKPILTKETREIYGI